MSCQAVIGRVTGTQRAERSSDILLSHAAFDVKLHVVQSESRTSSLLHGKHAQDSRAKSVGQ
jgi:hypothetical protein